jgi:uncharacterized protein YndB with AHSA1/START domain
MNKMAEIDTAQAVGAESFGNYNPPDTVHLERILPGPIERVWAYLTEPEKRSKWMADGSMELRVGGAVELVFFNSKLCGETTPERFMKYDGHPLKGTVTRFEPPHALGFSWGLGDSASHVEMMLSERKLSGQANGVLLTVTHTRLPGRDVVVNVSTGWHTHLGVLLDLLRGGSLRPFWPRFIAAEQEYEKRIPGLS